MLNNFVSILMTIVTCALFSSLKPVNLTNFWLTCWETDTYFPQAPVKMTELIRITKTGGRYLVFEVKDVAALRREHCICAVFVGTTPQNPNQNIFSGLPIELLPEEAKLLVDKGVAYIVDDAASHLSQLSTMDSSTRHAYLQSLRTRQRTFQRMADEQDAERKKYTEKMKAQGGSKRASRSTNQQSSVVINDDVNSGTTGARAGASIDNDSPFSFGDSVFSASAPPNEKTNHPMRLPPASSVASKMLHITPTTSVDILADLKAEIVPIEAPRAYPFYKHLNSKGYYITPGIRFGADYSVYPGDPFRFHAHFMATSFEWNEEIAVLDLVTGGRLGTGVKKGFLIGGKRLPTEVEQAEEIHGADNVRAFTLEWAAM